MAVIRGAGLARSAGARLKHAVRRRGPSPQPATRPPAATDPFLRLATDSSLWDDPFPTYEAMRAQGPAYSLFGTHVIVTAYEHVSAVLRDDRYQVESHTDAEVAGSSHDCILKQNPPRHDEVRRVMSKGFTPRAIEQLSELIVDRCNMLLDEAAGGDVFDVVQDYALPLAIGVIADILGIPQEHRARFRELGNSVARVLDPYLPAEELASLRTSSTAMLEYFDQMLGERRREPMEDLMSVLAAAEHEQVRVTPAEQRANAQFILLAGYETTVGMIGSGINILVDHPDVWSAMRGDTELVRKVVEEVLRLESPVQITNRRAGPRPPRSSRARRCAGDGRAGRGQPGPCRFPRSARLPA
jgi:cytochrome P450